MAIVTRKDYSVVCVCNQTLWGKINKHSVQLTHVAMSKLADLAKKRLKLSKRSSIAGEFLVAQLNKAFEAGLDLDACGCKTTAFPLKSHQLVHTIRKSYNLAHFHEDIRVKNYLLKFSSDATIRLERKICRSFDKILDNLLLEVLR